MMRITAPFLLLLLPAISFGQSFQKAANEAFLLTRMVNKFHVSPRPLDDSFSELVFNEFLKQADPRKTFFTREDINALSVYKTKLDDEIQNRQSTFLQAATMLYEQRLRQADTMIDNITRTPFNYNLPEKITVAEAGDYPANVAAMRIGLYKWMKRAVMNYMVAGREDIASLNAAGLKKYVDSIEPIGRAKAKSIYKRSIKRSLERPGGIAQEIADSYCKAIAVCFDPHSAYMPLTDKENFESGLGNKKMVFGFSMDENENGESEIDGLQPGSSAFKSGQFNKGDKIITVQWEGKSPIDVSDASAGEINRILETSNHDKMVFTIKKADGTTRQVPLLKEKSEDVEEDEKVKSFILKGEKSIGYISLPGFYVDWEDEEIGRNGCANDVAKEIVKLKKEKIDGLILDVRYNGGGSAQEAAELVGIFIDGGPVSQFKSKEPKVFTLKDMNRGTIYDGPLVVMVNGYSASASELVAAALQDYNRALIVGSNTYGKATGQLVLPMDTTIKMGENPSKKEAASYVKITTSQLYRINGTTAQGNGVMPDVRLPDMLEVSGEREADNPLSIKATTIDANKYYQPYAPLPLAQAKAVGEKEVENSPYFKMLKEYAAKKKASLEKKDISLRLSDNIKIRAEENSLEEPTADTTKASYIVTQHAFEKARLAADKDLQEMNDSWMELLLEDPYIRVTYKVILSMIK